MTIRSKNESKNYFKFKSQILLRSIDSNTVIQESDLSFQDDTCLYQFEYVQIENVKSLIKPGVYSVQSSNGNVSLIESQLQTTNLLTSVMNTKSIIEEANLFFNNLDVYNQLGGELGDQKVRKILMHSDPGCGKTSTIAAFALSAIKEDPGTVVLLWPTNQVEAYEINTFLADNTEYVPECTRLIMVAEDIGGAVHEGHSGPRAVDNDLLELLDGVKKKFKLPTLFLATTNYPENLLSALADRPGRFDLILKLNPLSLEERIALFEFKLKRSLSDEEKKAVGKKKTETFSPAHIREVVIRSLLKKWPLELAIDEMIAHQEQFKNNFQKAEKSMGFMDKDDF